MHLTLETDLGANNLIIYEFPKEEFADFHSQKSLSENGFPIPEIRRSDDDVVPPPNSKDKNISFIMSPAMSPCYEASNTN